MASEEPWKKIAAQKQAERALKIPKKWRLPDDILPKDPPKPEYGLQNVLDVPRKYLSASEIRITESYSVPSLLSAIATRRLTAREVAEAFSHRTALAHQLTNCLTEPLFDSAIDRAIELDEHLKAYGRPFGPLHGLPISVKDGFKIKGVDSSLGIASLCFQPANENAPLVELLLSLGCVIVAKTNVPQTLGSLDSVNNVFGRTMNPINRLLTAGGSSGGEGVLVAMKGSMVGWGTDVGGSIRVPAMCNGIFGVKPSVGRIPYGGQQGLSPEGVSRISIQAVAGPLARSVGDIDAVLREVVPRAKLFGEDCLASSWDLISSQRLAGSGDNGEFVFGILRCDGVCEILPPVRNVINEVSQKLGRAPGICVVELETPTAWTKCHSVINKLMGVDGGDTVFDLMEATGEPLVPWLSTRIRRGRPKALLDLAKLQAQRAQLEKEMLEIWLQKDNLGRRRRRIDAIICPLAPHPTPEIDRWNSAAYTSSWVLLDYPSACIPIRDIKQADLELGNDTMTKPILSSWDKKGRELWSEDKVDRRVYSGGKLGVQVVVSKAEDEQLIGAMKLVDSIMHTGRDLTSRL